MKAISTKYHGPSNVRGSRVSASDEDGNRVTISYDSSKNSEQAHDEAALKLCEKMSWHYGALARGGTKAGYVYVWIAAEDVVPVGEASVLSSAEVLTVRDRLERGGYSTAREKVCGARADHITVVVGR